MLKKSSKKWVAVINMTKFDNAWKESKYGVFSGPYFPAFGLNHQDLHSKSSYSKEIPENKDQKKIPYLDTFHAVWASFNVILSGNLSFRSNWKHYVCMLIWKKEKKIVVIIELQ